MYLLTGKSFVHEWAHYRYGVFDEYPTDVNGDRQQLVDTAGNQHTCGPNMTMAAVRNRIVPERQQEIQASLMSVTNVAAV